VLSTVQLTVDWDPDSVCPEFDQFISEVIPADRSTRSQDDANIGDGPDLDTGAGRRTNRSSARYAPPAEIEVEAAKLGKFVKRCCGCPARSTSNPPHLTFLRTRTAQLLGERYRRGHARHQCRARREERDQRVGRWAVQVGPADQTIGGSAKPLRRSLVNLTAGQM
jgi:hypothetical protein